MTTPSVVVGVVKCSISGAEVDRQPRGANDLLSCPVRNWPTHHGAFAVPILVCVSSSTRFCIYKLNVATPWVPQARVVRANARTVRCQDLDSSCLSTVNSRTRFDSAGLTLQVGRLERMSTLLSPTTCQYFMRPGRAMSMAPSDSYTLCG